MRQYLIIGILRARNHEDVYRVVNVMSVKETCGGNYVTTTDYTKGGLEQCLRDSVINANIGLGSFWHDHIPTKQGCRERYYIQTRYYDWYPMIKPSSTNTKYTIVSAIGTLGYRCVDTYGRVRCLSSKDLALMSNNGRKLTNASMRIKYDENHNIEKIFVRGLGWHIPVEHDGKLDTITVYSDNVIKKMKLLGLNTEGCDFDASTGDLNKWPDTQYLPNCTRIGQGAMIEKSHSYDFVDTLELPSDLKIICEAGLVMFSANELILNDALEVIEPAGIIAKMIDKIHIGSKLRVSEIVNDSEECYITFNGGWRFRPTQYKLKEIVVSRRNPDIASVDNNKTLIKKRTKEVIFTIDDAGNVIWNK